MHTNWAESYFAMLRKMQYGIHHKIGAQHLEAYANELAWRQDNREMKESEKIRLLLMLCLNMPPSEKWSKYWQRSRRLKNGAGIRTHAYATTGHDGIVLWSRKAPRPVTT